MFQLLFFIVLQVTGVPDSQPLQAEIHAPVPTDPDHTLWWIIGSLTTCIGVMATGIKIMYDSLNQAKKEEMERMVREIQRLQDMNEAKENTIKELISGFTNALAIIKEKAADTERKMGDLDKYIRDILTNLNAQFQQIINKLK